jgi:hypothetical protein
VQIDKAEDLHRQTIDATCKALGIAPSPSRS